MRRVWMATLGAVTLGCAIGLLASSPAGERTPPPPGSITIALTPLAENSTVLAYEPVLVRLTLTNRGDKEVSVPKSVGCLHLAVLNEAGTVLAETPIPRLQGEVMYSLERIPSGGSWSQVVVVTGLHEFDVPGEYVLRQQLLTLSDERRVVAETTAKLRVEPFDRARVEARCEELFQPLRTRRPYGELDWSCRLRALYSVRHDVVLPYLDWMAREWSDWRTCRAIRQVGTPRAMALLEALRKRTDSVGKAARHAVASEDEGSLGDVVD